MVKNLIWKKLNSYKSSEYICAIDYQYLALPYYCLRSCIPMPKENLLTNSFNLNKESWQKLPCNLPSQIQCSSHLCCCTHSWTIYWWFLSSKYKMKTWRDRWRLHSGQRWSGRSWRSQRKRPGMSCPRTQRQSQTFANQSFNVWKTKDRGFTGYWTHL